MKKEKLWQSLSPVVLLRASVAVALLTIALKMGAWWLTDSVGLLSDALESFVNLAGAMFALLMVTIARRPADAEHPFGHSKAEYFSSGFEGILIVGAALAIVWASVHRLLNPAPLQSLDWGIGLSVLSSLFNGLLALVMLRSAQVHRSMALQADARHLMTDVWTSVGVVLALVAVHFTGWLWLDGAIAILVALNILKEGGHLIWQSSRGLMDEAIEPEHLAALHQVLQRYTQLHRDDPYAAALAVSESKRRATLRQAGQAQTQPAPDQPTVLDSALGQGLGAVVPDSAMAMADGGIVGYAEGGSLEEQRQRDREGIARFGSYVWDKMKRAGAATADVVTLPVRGLAGAYDSAVVRPMRAAGLDAGYLSPHLVPEGADVDSMTPFYDQRYRQDEPTQDYGNEGRRTPAPPMSSGIAQVAPMPEPSTKDTPPSRMPQVGGSASRTSRPDGQAPDSQYGATMTEGERRLKEMADADRSAAAEDLAEFDKDVAARGVLGADREKRLLDKEAGLEGKRGDARRMALIEAGLSILSADPSRGAFAAIGEGALKGVKTYKGDIKELEAQRDQIEEKMDQLSDLRRQEAIATGTERRGLNREIRKVESQAKRDMFSLFKDVGVPMKMKDVEMTFLAQQKELDRAAAEKNARISSASGSRNNQLEIIDALSKNPELLRTYQSMNGSKAKPQDLMGDFTDYLKANPTAAMLPPEQALRDFMKVQALFSTMGSKAAPVTDKPGATVLSR